jgi:dTDP-4-amino-4,6-dideoxygalactose transaminase
MNTYQSLLSALPYIKDALERLDVSGDGFYTKKCEQWLLENFETKGVLLTTSCTHAMELAIHCLDLQPDDEVIVPSYTFPSTANVVLLAGANVVFAPVNSKDLTLDLTCLETFITPRTKAVIPVHYGGVCCDMASLMLLANQYDLIVIEDAAQAFFSTSGGKRAGTIGHFGCFSFHGTKDFVAGEGGALLINDETFKQRAERFRVKGTNRNDFLLGEVSRYEWVSKGSSYSPSELNMALLYSQFIKSDEILLAKRVIFEIYENHFREHPYSCLDGFSEKPLKESHNGHLFYIRFKHSKDAQFVQTTLKAMGITLIRHFVPLHLSSMGRQLSYGNNLGSFQLEDYLHETLLRLPCHVEMNPQEAYHVLNQLQRVLWEVCG